jgi:hypothetical protein
MHERMGGYMRMALGILSIGLAFTFSSAANAATNYSTFEKSFQKAAEPAETSLAQGWYAGRCYTARERNVEKAGLLVLMPGNRKSDGAQGVKILLPGASIDVPADKYDRFDPQDYERYRELLFPEQNDVARKENSSLVTELSYDQGLLGTLHLRQSGSSLILAMTNFEDIPKSGGNARFYCRFGNKVHDLDPSDIR